MWVYTVLQMRPALILTALLVAATARAQWEIQTAPTTADLRGIHALGNGIAWASGSDGAVLRTTDDGAHWQRCATPPDAEALDFRGIQAFDANTAIVMSSGKGPLSRLYKTTDGCHSWKLVFTNPDRRRLHSGFCGTRNVWGPLVRRDPVTCQIGSPSEHQGTGPRMTTRPRTPHDTRNSLQYRRIRLSASACPSYPVRRWDPPLDMQ
jgi:hypothetical protein